MIAEMAILFPLLQARKLSEFDPAYVEGVWTSGDGDPWMPDGMSIFCSWANGVPPYDGNVHAGFLAWLANRGWLCECHDGATYFLLPDDRDGDVTGRPTQPATPTARHVRELLARIGAGGVDNG